MINLPENIKDSANYLLGTGMCFFFSTCLIGCSQSPNLSYPPYTGTSTTKIEDMGYSQSEGYSKKGKNRKDYKNDKKHSDKNENEGKPIEVPSQELMNPDIAEYLERRNSLIYERKKLFPEEPRKGPIDKYRKELRKYVGEKIIEQLPWMQGPVNFLKDIEEIWEDIRNLEFVIGEDEKEYKDSKKDLQKNTANRYGAEDKKIERPTPESEAIKINTEWDIDLEELKLDIEITKGEWKLEISGEYNYRGDDSGERQAFIFLSRPLGTSE